jgi:hypothetical protein
MNLSKYISIVRGTSGTHSLADPDNTTHVGPAVDMKGFDGCMFLYVGSTKFTSNTTGATAHIKVGASTTALKNASTGTFALNITGATSQGWNRRIAVIDVYKPLHRYVQPRMKIGFATTGNAKVEWLAVKYAARRPGSTAYLDRGTTGSTGIAGSTVFVSPTT